MYSKKETSDNRGRQKPFEYISKSKTAIYDSGKFKIDDRMTNVLKTAEDGNKSPSSERRKQNLRKIDENKNEIYKNMKRLLERKYKNITLKQDSGERLVSQRKEWNQKFQKIKPENNNLPLSEIPSKKVGNSVTNSPHMKSSKTKTLLKNKATKQNDKLPTDKKAIQKRKLDVLSPASELSDSKKLLKTKETKQPSILQKAPKTPEKTTKYKASKRLANLARHKELPTQVQKDLAYKPFKVSKKALLFRDNPCKLTSGLNHSRSKTVQERIVDNIFEPKKKIVWHIRNRRRLVNSTKYCFPTQRLLELAQPVIKLPPTDVLPDEVVFTVKKRALKAKCSKRISELAFPQVRAEEMGIKADHSYRAKRRALRARCTRRIRELAKPLARRCHVSIKKSKAEEQPGSMLSEINLIQ